MLLKDLTWPEVRSLDFSKLIVILPTGSSSNTATSAFHDRYGHCYGGCGRHRARDGGPRALTPTLWPGLSTHHMHFPGTLDVTQDVYIRLIVELGKSLASMGAKKVFILNGHGGNDTPLRAALRELKTAVPDRSFVFASYWTIAAQTLTSIRESKPGGVGHACEMETSVMLHLCPDRVKMELAARDGSKHTDPFRIADMQVGRPVFFVSEFHEMSESGVIGHPDLASAAKGKRFLDGIIAEVCAFVEHYLTWEE